MPLARTYPGQSCRHDAVHIARGTYRLLRALCLLLAWLPAAGAANVTPDTEYRIKTAFLYNFARFVTWPALPQDEFRLCVLGSPQLDRHADTLQYKTVHERRLRVLHLSDAAMLARCQMLFIGTGYTARLHEVLSALGDRPVLTVSDIAEFTRAGGMIGFLVVDNKIRFEINAGAAERAGVSISSKLLTLATAITARAR
ncbi:MAG: YfiR family protein [Gammaproteobacteria bacterium]|jgi:hypothetical protein